MARRTSMPGVVAAVSVASAAGMLAGVVTDQELHAAATGLPAPLPEFVRS
jgi:hypothetical protein